MGMEQSKNQTQSAQRNTKTTNRNRAQLRATPLTQIRRRNPNAIASEYTFDSCEFKTGAYGVVKRAVHKATGLVRAVKFVDKSELKPQELRYIYNEIEVLGCMDHPSVLELIEHFEDDNYIAIVTNYIEGGDLFDRIVEQSKFNENEAAKIIKQVLIGINYMHKQSIVHRDIKPENIMFERDIAKIIDFGSAVKFSKGRPLTKLTGTYFYVAPEVISGNYDEKCDIWSIGVIAYLLVTGVLPFNGHKDSEVMRKISFGQYRMDIPEFSGVSASARDFISSLMQMDARIRLSAEEALNHPWLACATENDTCLSDPLMFFNLQDTSLETKIQRYMYLYMIVHLMPQSKKSKLEDVFLTWDKDNDGFISKNELANGLQNMRVDLTSSQITKIFNTLTDNNGKGLTYSQLLLGCIDKSELTEDEALQKCFNSIDVDSVGRITLMQFKSAFGDIERIDQDIWSALVRKFKCNSSAGADYTQFKRITLDIN